MKKILLLVAAPLTIGTASYAQSVQSWNLKPDAQVRFEIVNSGNTVEGTFSNLSGTILFDPANLTGSSLDVKLEVTTVDTKTAARDKHLRNADFFDVEKFPYISFTSTSITKTAAGYEATGTLTIKDVSKTVTIPFTATQTNTETYFKGDFTINRVDYGVGGSSGGMSQDVTLFLEITTTKAE